jgi:hypothetical protein
MDSRRSGILFEWRLSVSGGMGKVICPATRELFFICKRFISSGEPIVGSVVTFTTLPPQPGTKYLQATDCVIDNTKRFAALDLLGEVRL